MNKHDEKNLGVMRLSRVDMTPRQYEHLYGGEVSEDAIKVITYLDGLNIELHYDGIYTVTIMNFCEQFSLLESAEVFLYEQFAKDERF